MLMGLVNTLLQDSAVCMDGVAQRVACCWVVFHSFTVADGTEASGAAICTFGREFC